MQHDKSPAGVVIYADGACKGNPGPGGWGALLLYPDGLQAELWGGESATTNNRMELTAAIRALAHLPQGSRAQVWTDSSYVQKGITEWLPGWKKRNWRKADGKPVLNADLWQQLDQQCARHQVSWHWVRGHNGHPGNEAADQLANRGVTDPQGPALLHCWPPLDPAPAIPSLSAPDPVTAMAEFRFCPPPSRELTGHRQLIFDTETTGLEVHTGDRIIEIGLIEVVDRKPTGQQVHLYLNPDRTVGDSYAIHGLSDAFLADKPRFAEVAHELSAFMAGAELIAHNAMFDVRFLDSELQRCALPPLLDLGCRITDTLLMAKKRYPGQKNTLDALIKRCHIRPRDRTFHGALLDAEILMDIYLAMTGGQVTLGIQDDRPGGEQQVHHRRFSGRQLRVVVASALELAQHQHWLEKGDSAGLWQALQPPG